MSFELRGLGAEDNAALLALAATSNTGSEVFRVERSPDFFALGRFLGEPTYLGVFDRELLVGCIGLTKQRRYLGGKPAEFVYAHDLRVHPRYQTTRVIVTLLEAAASACEERRAFGTVLDGSPHQASFERRLAGFVGEPRVLGRTVHLGASLFAPPELVRGTDVRPLPPEEAMQAYRRLASRRSFAPVELSRFAEAEGEFLGVFRGDRIVAVGKLLDQSPERRILAVEPGWAMALMGMLARMRGCAPMPRRGEELLVGYLALYASEDGTPYDASMIAYVRDRWPKRFAYVFRGMSEDDAAARSFGRLALRLSSKTYGFGRWADGVELGYHELALV